MSNGRIAGIITGANVAEPFCHEQFPETPTYVMGGHLMAYEYPEKFNARLEEFLASEGK